MLENILSLNGVKPLRKEKQSIINGGMLSLGPCGPTGATVYHSDPTCHCPGVWAGGKCWICH